jgi:hypothetical protein
MVPIKWFQEFSSKKIRGSKKLDIVPRKNSFVAHGRSIFGAVRQKPRYIEHTNLDFESKKCVTKLRPRVMQ